MTSIKRVMAKPMSRTKRNVYDLSKSVELSHREKRDTLKHVDSVMENIRTQLSGLQVSPRRQTSCYTNPKALLARF